MLILLPDPKQPAQDTAEHFGRSPHDDFHNTASFLTHFEQTDAASNEKGGKEKHKEAYRKNSNDYDCSPQCKGKQSE